MAIVEQKDANPMQLAICEINTGILVASYASLCRWLTHLGNNNAQGEYYLTDVVELAVADQVHVHAAQPEDPMEVMGVNDRVQLAALERHHQQSKAERLMRAGVTLADPTRFDVRGDLRCGMDVEIDVNVLFVGKVELGDGVKVGANCVIRDSRIGDGVEIFPNSIIEEAEVGAESRIGPFARLRPEARLADHVHVGNFVEIKKSDIASASKINHLSYIGDTSIGTRVNIGAGTITCNYDGANKHRTEIGDDVFVGSDTQLVAPVKVGDGATIGAGSTITRAVAADALTLCRATEQRTVKGWKRPVKGVKKR
jgi:bifunctional UDP-N-acetylglucosamine pyrophosphorylase/glucosamine-1-phosphate N-acetyltransferase